MRNALFGQGQGNWRIIETGSDADQTVVARRRKVSLDEGSNPRDQFAASSAIDRVQSGQEPSRNCSYAILADVTSRLRDLDELVQSYGPTWYTENIARVRRTLAAAETGNARLN